MVENLDGANYKSATLFELRQVSISLGREIGEGCTVSRHCRCEQLSMELGWCPLFKN
jgi:hypothetical protein